MIKVCIPFLLTEPDQILNQEIFGTRVSFEANIFDGIVLKKLIDNKQFDLLLKGVVQMSNLSAFHFPTENADYLESDIIFNTLIESLKIVGKNNIPYLILHSNLIRSISHFDYSEVLSKRKKFIKQYETLDKIAGNSNVIVCIENLPIIGNDGNDFDSVFVFPNDYGELNFKNVKVVWDIGHWAYTCAHFSELSGYYRHVNTTPKFRDFFEIEDKIVRLHFSSFKNGYTTDGTLKHEEGIIPQQGDFSENELIDVCRTINSLERKFDMTLEIKEEKYTNRKNTILTIDWLKSNLSLN